MAATLFNTIFGIDATEEVDDLLLTPPPDASLWPGSDDEPRGEQSPDGSAA